MTPINAFKAIQRTMPRLLALTGFLGLAILAMLDTPRSFAQTDFCWRDSLPRGVGAIPSACPAGRERIGVLCYSPCPAGMRRFGVDCHSVCPNGMRDDGLFCRTAEYGRGAGYPWKFGDRLGSLDAARARCAGDNPQGCEQNGQIIYPRCKPGYHPFGCCICRPDPPNCAALGMNGSVDLSCAKKVMVGNPVTGSCGPGQEKDGGLCYRQCPAGYAGAGPVCWATPPPGWVNCGMGAAKTSATCASNVFSQVNSVATIALNVASLGTATAETEGINQVEHATQLARLKQQYQELKNGFNAVKNRPEVQASIRSAKATHKVSGSVDTYESAQTPEDIARASAELASVLDPSGVSGAVAAYTYPKCSALGFIPGR